MNTKAIRKRIEEKGWADAVRYYGNRTKAKLAQKIFQQIIAFCLPADEHLIVFKNRKGQDYSDNARALSEYLLEQGYTERYRIVWMVSDPGKCRKEHPSGLRFVTAESVHGADSLRAYYYGARAKYFFYTNNTADLNRYHCKGQQTINLWHGCGYKGATRKNSEIPRSKTMEWFDYALVPGDVFVDTKADYWECDREKILPLGLPRYDWMLHPPKSKAEVMETLFGWKDPATKLILWMPTFRQTEMTGYAENKIELPFDLPALNSEQELEELDHACQKENCLLVIKKHPLQREWSCVKAGGNIRYVTDQQLQEILLYQFVGVADALISDYSSIAVDYMLLERPIGYVLTDLEEYKNARGFVFEDPLEYMPGERIYDKKDLIRFITQVRDGEDPYASMRKELMPKMHNITGNYRKRIVESLEM